MNPGSTRRRLERHKTQSARYRTTRKSTNNTPGLPESVMAECGWAYGGRLRSGQTQQTVNLPPQRLRRFESSPPHQPSLASRASAGKPAGVDAGFTGRPAAGDEMMEAAAQGDVRRGLARRSADDVERREGGSNSVVESQPSKLLVAGSIPVSRSKRTDACSRRPAAGGWQ